MEFDINSARSLFTVMCLIIFVGVVWWAYSSRNASDFEAAARLPFEQD